MVEIHYKFHPRSGVMKNQVEEPAIHQYSTIINLCILLQIHIVVAVHKSTMAMNRHDIQNMTCVVISTYNI